MTEEDFYGDDRDGVICPRCSGDGTVDCYCGGDFCVCDNHGERDCPTCHGEGEVSEQREAQYLENQRLAHEAMRKAWGGGNSA